MSIITSKLFKLRWLHESTTPTQAKSVILGHENWVKNHQSWLFISRKTWLVHFSGILSEKIDILCRELFCPTLISLRSFRWKQIMTIALRTCAKLLYCSDVSLVLFLVFYSLFEMWYYYYYYYYSSVAVAVTMKKSAFDFLFCIVFFVGIWLFDGSINIFVFSGGRWGCFVCVFSLLSIQRIIARRFFSFLFEDSLYQTMA